MSAFLHRIRRWLWMLLPWWTRTNDWLRCFDCGLKMTDDERIHYGCHCERCEGLTRHE